MAKSFTGRKRVRKSFGRIPEVAPMPNLIEVQRRSYEQFLQREVKAENRKDAGLQEVFKSVFPIRDFSNRAELQFVRYELEDPRYDVVAVRRIGDARRRAGIGHRQANKDADQNEWKYKRT